MNYTIRHLSLAVVSAMLVATSAWPVRVSAVDAPRVVVSEIHPSGSGNGTYGADWFEVTNTGTTAVDISGWKFDDNSNTFANAVALRGVTSLPAGQSAVFLEGVEDGSTDAALIASFSTAWFGSTMPPAGVLIGAYGGSGVGMSGSGDAVNLFDAAGVRVTGVSFGAAATGAPLATFDNSAGLGSATLPLPAVTKVSVPGVNGAAVSTDSAEIGSPGFRINASPLAGVDLSSYVRIGRFDLPEPTRTAAPANSVLAQEASAVTYNWNTDTLFIVGDGGTSIVQVTKTGALIDSMTLATGSSPQGTEFYDTEGLTYVGAGRFVLMQERDREAVLFTYVPGTTLTRDATQSVKLGTFADNMGIEGITYDPQTAGFIAVKETAPQGIFQTGIDFVAGTATNGSPTTENSIDLFNPALAGLLDFADVFALSNMPSLTGPQAGNLLLLSQESATIVNIDRNGVIASSLAITADPGSPLSVADQQHEGLTMDGNGVLYVVNENGGGDSDHPQLWVYAPSLVPNEAPTSLTLNNAVASMAENTNTSARLKVADVAIADDGLGSNVLSVTGLDAGAFEVDNSGLYLKAGTVLDFETKTSYSVTVQVDDASAGATPDATAGYTLTVTDVDPETPSVPASLVITEVTPWASGDAPYGVDWFEVTNTGASAVDITGWKMDDDSSAFATGVALSGITSIAPGESVIFMETSDLATTKAAFLTAWFGTNVPAGLQVGAYSGGGVGLSTGGDSVNLFDAGGNRVTGVAVGASVTGFTFDNAGGAGSATLPLPSVSTLSVAGTNGAFLASDGAETGSPGRIAGGAVLPSVIISEVTPWASGDAPYAADWFEVTNKGGSPVNLTGWKMDDASGSFASAVALNGVTTLAPGESAIFLETDDLPTTKAAFLSAWFAENPPTGLQVGNYTGGGVGLSTGGDSVNLFDAGGNLVTGVSFGDASTGYTFDNAAGLGSTMTPLPALSTLSVPGSNGAFLAADSVETGSPGTVGLDANQDVTAPEIAPVSNITVEATGPAGAAVSYTAPATLDDVDGAGVAACNPATGTTFGLGATTVTCMAEDAAGNSASSTFVVNVGDTTAPAIAAMSDLATNATSAAGAVVTFTAPATTDAVHGAGTAACLPASGSTFAIGVTPVVCTAQDGAGNTATRTFTVTVHDMTPAAPSAPQALSASIDGNIVTLAWGAPAVGIPTGYTLVVRTTAGEPVLVQPVGLLSSLTVPAPNGVFVVSVLATNAIGTGPESTTVTVTVPTALPLPGNPTGLTATTTGDIATFMWTPPASGGAVQGYVLAAGTSAGFTVPVVTLPLPAAPATVTIGNIPPGAYWVRLYAQNSSGVSAMATNEVMISVAAPAAPGAPMLLPATVTDHTVALSWAPGAGGTPASYLMGVAATPGGVPAVILPLTGTAISFPGIPSGTYYARMVAVNSVGMSAVSNEIMIVVP